MLSLVPLITKSAVESAIRTRRRRPIFMVDLAVPRDIEPAVADLEDVYLFCIDDLQQLIDENRQQREVAAGGARLLIEEEVALGSLPAGVQAGLTKAAGAGQDHQH